MPCNLLKYWARGEWTWLCKPRWFFSRVSVSYGSRHSLQNFPLLSSLSLFPWTFSPSFSTCLIFSFNYLLLKPNTLSLNTAGRRRFSIPKHYLTLTLLYSTLFSSFFLFFFLYLFFFFQVFVIKASH